MDVASEDKTSVVSVQAQRQGDMARRMSHIPLIRMMPQSIMLGGEKMIIPFF